MLYSTCGAVVDVNYNSARPRIIILLASINTLIGSMGIMNNPIHPPLAISFYSSLVELILLSLLFPCKMLVDRLYMVIRVKLSRRKYTSISLLHVVSCRVFSNYNNIVIYLYNTNRDVTYCLVKQLR